MNGAPGQEEPKNMPGTAYDGTRVQVLKWMVHDIHEKFMMYTASISL